MKKLILAVLGLVVVLLIALVLKNANFNFKNLMNSTSLTTTTPSQSGSGSATTSPSRVAAEILITVTDSGFVPQVITISAGTKITWVNKSSSDANVSSDPHPTHTDYPPLNLGTFGQNNSVSLVFNKPGRYGYHDHLIPSETGTIIVQ